MIKDLKKETWLEYRKRDIPVLRLFIIYESFCYFYKKDIGWPYVNAVATGKKSFFNIYRSQQGFRRYANDFLKVRNKKKFFNNLLTKLKNKGKKIEKDLFFYRKQVNKLTKELKLKAVLKLLAGDLRDIWSLQDFPFNLEIALINTNNQKIVTKYKKYLVKLRKVGQYVTVNLEDLIDEILRKIAKIKKIDFRLIYYATLPEIINNKINLNSLKKREKLVVVGHFKNKVFICQGKEAKAVDNYFKKISLKNYDSKVLEGKSAYPGKVLGTVKLILFRKDLKDLKKGQILVTPMTEVFYAPYLKKVKAIITDEGGITTHAAIIARELKIPCVVGTKIATKVLKNGDKVEVDANKGVINKLS